MESNTYVSEDTQEQLGSKVLRTVIKLLLLVAVFYLFIEDPFHQFPIGSRLHHRLRLYLPITTILVGIVNLALSKRKWLRDSIISGLALLFIAFYFLLPSL